MKYLLLVLALVILIGSPMAHLSPAPSVKLLSIALSPTSVVGGNSSQGTVTLTKRAPSGGLVVTLTSSQPSVASVPVNVTVASGQTTGTFTVTTSTVSVTTVTTISASYGGVTKTANLTVAAADTTAPVISAVTASSITSSGATITWSTNEASDSQVDYGTTTAYGSSTMHSTLVTSHSVVLGGLSADTLYHYRVKSRDAAGNLGISGDFSLTTATAATPTTFYVATTGSDSNSCVAAQNPLTPKRTMAGASGCMAAGDIMIVSAGTYAESIGDSFLPPSGSDASHKTVIKAASGETVILRPSGVNRVVDLNGSSIAYIEINGFVMDSSLLSSDTVKITGGAHDIDIINCDISMGSTPNPHAGQGVLISNTPPINQNVLIQNCVIHGNGNSSGSQDHQIYVSHTNAVTIDGCTFYDSTSHGVQVWDGGVGGCSNIIIKNNTAFGCDRGFGVYAGSGNVLYNNIAYSNNYGIFFRNDGGTLTSPAAYNNTLVSNAVYGLRIQSIAVGKAVARNNICYLNVAADLLDEDSSTLSNNLTGTNPNFVDLNGHDYHLTVNSTTAIDQGTNIATFTTDKDGIARPQGSAWDIGAYELPQ